MNRGRLCRNNCCSSSRPTEVSRVLSVGALQRVTLSSPTRCQCLPPAAVGRLKQEKPALGSALIHGETSVWSANITAKQASKLTQEQITEYKGVFEMFDEEGNGDVKTQELERLMSLMGINPTKRELIQMAKDVDKDGKGIFNCDSFLGLMALYNERTKNQNAELRAAFKVFDKEAKGYIDWNTLKYVLMNAGEPLNEIEAEQMMKEADKDGDGTINYEEFVAMMTGDSFKMS